MASTYSPNKNYELQATGENQGTWGLLLNNNALSVVDLNLGGRLAKTIDAANVTLTSDEQENVFITLTGVLTGNRDLIFTATAGGFYFIKNDTSGAFTVTAKPSGGTGVVCPQGAISVVFINPTATSAFLLSWPNVPAGTSFNPPSNDGASLGTTALGWSDLFLATGAVVNWNNGDVTITHSANALAFAGAASGYTFSGAVAITGALSATTSVTGASILATSNDSGALGASGTAWADLFLASGGVLNWNAGNYTITHSAGNLAFNGAITLGTDLAIAEGGTGASTAAGARTNFGLGTAAVKNTGTSGDAVPLLDQANTWATLQTYSTGIAANRSGQEPIIVQRTDAFVAAQNYETFYNASSTLLGNIISNGANTTIIYNSSSDARLKEKDVELQVEVDVVGLMMQLRPVAYNWRSNPEGPREMGFFAQELVKVIPGAGSAGSEAGPGEAGFIPAGVDYGKVTPLLTAALQIALERIASLEERLAAMEQR